jgi:hypothetical protein
MENNLKILGSNPNPGCLKKLSYDERASLFCPVSCNEEKNDVQLTAGQQRASVRDAASVADLRPARLRSY